MRKFAIITAVLFVTFLGFFSGMIARGWEATPQSLVTGDDALSVCVRGVAGGRISPLKFPDCITLTFIHVERQELIESALHKERQLEESLRKIEETRKGFRKLMEPPQGDQYSI